MLNWSLASKIRRLTFDREIQLNSYGMMATNIKRDYNRAYDRIFSLAQKLVNAILAVKNFSMVIKTYQCLTFTLLAINV